MQSEVDVTLGGGERETKEHVLEKHMFPPTESAFLPTDKLWVALDTQHLDA